MPAPSPPHTPLRLSPRRELRLRNLRLRPGGKETRWERAEGKGAVAGWVRARPAPARVPAFQETWKPKIKVRRDRCPEPGAWVPGWALSLGRQGGDPAGADAAPRRNPGSEPQPRTSDFQVFRPLLKQSTGPLCPARGAWPSRSPRLLGRRRGHARSSRLLGAALSERSGRGGPAASAR